MSMLVTQGTQTAVYSLNNGGTEIPVIKLDVGAGTTLSAFTGTLDAVTNLAGGTITNIGGGTIQHSSLPVQLGTSFTVVGTAGAGFWGTIIAAAGAGTKQYVSGVDIIGVGGTVEVVVTNIGVTGSAGAGILARGFIPPSGGISKNFNPVIASSTNGTLAYWMGGAGTVDITVQYWNGI